MNLKRKKIVQLSIAILLKILNYDLSLLQYILMIYMLWDAIGANKNFQLYYLNNRFDMKYLGEIKLCLGLEIANLQVEFLSVVAPGRFLRVVIKKFKLYKI